MSGISIYILLVCGRTSTRTRIIPRVGGRMGRGMLSFSRADPLVLVAAFPLDGLTEGATSWVLAIFWTTAALFRSEPESAGLNQVIAFTASSFPSVKDTDPSPMLNISLLLPPLPQLSHHPTKTKANNSKQTGLKKNITSGVGRNSAITIFVAQVLCQRSNLPHKVSSCRAKSSSVGLFSVLYQPEDAEGVE